MAWSPLATQFCLELCIGVLVAMAFVPKAPVGVLFYRIMGTTALVPALVAFAAPAATGNAAWLGPVGCATLLPILAYPIYSGPVRGARWAAALAAAIAGAAAGLWLLVDGQVAPQHTVAAPRLALAGLASASAIATGVVAGSVGLAMVLGHWYLTIPNLQVSHLRRLNRVTIVSMVASAVLLTVTCLLLRGELVSGDRGLFAPRGLFHFGTRVVVGLALPLLFAAMTASSLRYGNTRSATGILYASTVLVLIGTALSVTLQDAYRFPL